MNQIITIIFPLRGKSLSNRTSSHPQEPSGSCARLYQAHGWPARSLALCLALSLAAGSAGAAGWSDSPLINNPVCTAASNQELPQIVADAAGGAIITWQDYRSGTGTADIYAQRYDAAGAPQWTANGVAVCTAAGDQRDPQIAADGAGGAIITWRDTRSGTSEDIYAQRYDAAGAPQWTANGVAVSTAANNQFFPQIAADAAGGAIITWHDNRSGIFDIYAQRVNAAGAPQWTANGVAVSTAASLQEFPQIAADGAGGAIITWRDARNGGAYDIYAQRVNAAGAPQWTANGVAVSTAANTQDTPQIAADGAGGAIITWTDSRSGDYDIYAQRYDAAGAPQWTANGVAVSTAANDQLFPQIAADAAGGAIITWRDLRSGLNYDIYAQRVNAAGAPQWTANGVAVSTAANDQVESQIAADAAGGAIITWQDNRSGTNYDIYAQRYDAGGVLPVTMSGFSAD